ncbi:c-type cytochrome [Robbsia andropogonis]|uniref:c-type cytochrome n=2 Tax=Robbsia andropogonis TaxID=28092 RepID=UPI0020A025A3|nr:c-type cytochrome [Robbsia andropogonis]
MMRMTMTSLTRVLCTASVSLALMGAMASTAYAADTANVTAATASAVTTPTAASSAAPQVGLFAPSLVEKGRYLATASDCIACHTATGGRPMAGGLAIASPVGTIIASNITPSKTHGIGNYTEQQFADALRKGVRADGANLYPAMPYTAYATLSNDDIHALYAYFMQGVTPVDTPTAATHLPFPMNIRLSMRIWNALFLNDKPYVTDPSQSEEWNRGRYLVDGAAHCSTCHTPRGVLMQEKQDLSMAGAQVGPWYAPNITADATHGIGTWTQKDLVTYLKTGRLPGKAQAAGSMAEAITHSFRYLTDADVNAIAVYMMHIPAIGDGVTQNPATSSRFDQGKASSDLAAFRGKGFEAGMASSNRGGVLFSANCASCHGYNGQGSEDGYYPSLFHNSATAGANPNNLLATILYGVDRETASGHVFMPSFGSQPGAVTNLSNEDVAALANYVLTQYGNSARAVTPADVAAIRQGGPRSNLLTMTRVGIGVGMVVVLIAIGSLLMRGRRKQGRAQR